MTTDELSCTLECSQLLARLCLALDRGANSEAADLFTEDAVLVMPNGESVGPAVRQRLESRPATIATRHILTNTVITPTGPATAEAQAYISVYRVPAAPDDVLPRRLPPSPQALGDWALQLRKTAAGWKISRYHASEAMTPAE